MLNFSEIENYIFDFGGVLYEIDLEISIRELCKRSLNPDINKNGASRDYSNYKLFNDYECGKISTDDFLKTLKSEFDLNISFDEIFNIWNMILIGPYNNSIEIIKRFKKRGRVFLFSNTSEIHYSKFYPECIELFGQFEECFFSFLIGLRKPDAESFKYILKKHNLNPEKTLFIDDYIKNIEGARQIGLQVYHINNMNSLSDLLHSVESDTQVK